MGRGHSIKSWKINLALTVNGRIVSWMLEIGDGSLAKTAEGGFPKLSDVKVDRITNACGANMVHVLTNNNLPVDANGMV